MHLKQCCAATTARGRPAISRHSSPGTVIPALLLALVAGRPGGAEAQVARMEVHPLASTTLTDQEFLTGRKEGTPVTLAAELRIPRPGSARLPAVVLLHGSGGIAGYVADWEQELNAAGVATLVVDSFTGRGIVSTVNDQARLGRLAMIVDAYCALALLAKHPQIDPSRIVLMGFSRGGRAALYASLRRFRKMHGPSGLEFAAYIPFYPECGTTFREDEEISDKPIRIFHGTADDYASIAPCRSYVERLKAKGKDVTLTEYAGAGHMFDAPALKQPIQLKQAPTTRGCSLAEGADGRIVNTKTNEPFTYADQCVEYGPTIAWDEAAAAAAHKAVQSFLASTLSVH